MGAIGAPLDLLGENLLYGLHRMDTIVIAVLTWETLRLPANGYCAIEIILAVLAAMNNAAVLSMDILL